MSECVHETRLPALVGQTAFGYGTFSRSRRLLLTAQIACWLVWDVYGHDLHEDKVSRWGQQITAGLVNFISMSVLFLVQNEQKSLGV